MKPSPEEWVDWGMHPCTREFLQNLEQKRVDRSIELADKETPAYDDYLTGKGTVAGIKEVIRDIEDLTENKKQRRT